VKRLKIIVDSTSDIPEHFMKEYDIDVVPLYVILPDGTQEKDTWREEEKREFYKRLMESPEIPDTSQPTVQDFVQKYREVEEQGYDEILVITISTQMSGTYNSATLAAKEVDIPVYVFDSLRASAIVAMMARDARLAHQRGMETQEIIDYMKRRFESGDYQAVFYVANFEYLVKGGRISKFQGFLGTMLRLKVNVFIDETGNMIPYAKSRGTAKAQKAIIGKLKELGYREGEKIEMMTITAGADDEAQRLCEEFRKSFEVVFCDSALTAKVITKHVAPGMVGAAVVRYREG
jgi:DegV family protein with EDD domain